RRPLCSFVLIQCLRPLNSTLFPYTTLFRSHDAAHRRRQHPRQVRLAGSCPPGAGARCARVAACGASTIGVVAGYFARPPRWGDRSEEHTSELQSRENLVCRLLLEKKKNQKV